MITDNWCHCETFIVDEYYDGHACNDVEQHLLELKVKRMGEHLWGLT